MGRFWVRTRISVRVRTRITVRVRAIPNNLTHIRAECFFGNSKVGVWCLYIAVVVYIVVAFGVLCYRFDLVVDAAVRLCRILVFFFWGFTVYCLLSLINCCTTVDVSISATDERCRYCLIRLVLNV